MNRAVNIAMQNGVLGAISPGAQAVGSAQTAWVSLSNFTAIMAIIQAGTLGAAATLDAKFEQAQDAAGTGAKDITGAAITQLVKATDDDKQAVIGINSADLDANNSFNHVRLTLTVGGATSNISALLIGADPRYGPANDYDAASVAEVVIVE